MPGLFVVVLHVVIFRQVTASNVSTNQADAQVQPIITQLYAFGACLGVARSNLLHEIDM
jgi:hypothetical protein